MEDKVEKRVLRPRVGSICYNPVPQYYQEVDQPKAGRRAFRSQTICVEKSNTTPKAGLRTKRFQSVTVARRNFEEPVRRQFAPPEPRGHCVDVDSEVESPSGTTNPTWSKSKLPRPIKPKSNCDQQNTAMQTLANNNSRLLNEVIGTTAQLKTRDAEYEALLIKKHECDVKMVAIMFDSQKKDAIIAGLKQKMAKMANSEYCVVICGAQACDI